MSIKEDFEKAYGDEFWPDGDSFKYDGYDTNEVVQKVALWAAKWMAERCAHHVIITAGLKVSDRGIAAKQIRLLASELKGEKK